jgi:hypothetical protein
MNIIKIRDEYFDKTQDGKVEVRNDARKFSTLKGKTEVLIKDNSITLSNLGLGIIICDYGNIIKGPIHLADSPSSVRINGFWVFNDELMTTLPSTTYTPIPVLVYKESPYAKTIQGYIKTLTSS